ncbi:hypothetical protein MUS1_04280 [Marinomonas ushuaiensis DSM 15871]|uniref:Uncharacterized protein n=1 Tax=Marinomonas ushuaiensis DSM 15871 TaxID=1122207 RepID=X7E2D7_9GAMM|nr:hypothetical protein MUS1_04280 [Marinomonas ushuaiensis DSM 15871]
MPIIDKNLNALIFNIKINFDKGFDIYSLS